MSNVSKIDKFLEELKNISEKYNLYIGGCGCCHSPYLENRAGVTKYGDLYFDKHLGKYVVRKVEEEE